VHDVGEQHGDLGEGVGDHPLTGFEAGSTFSSSRSDRSCSASMRCSPVQRLAAAHRFSQHQHGSEHGRIRHRITQQGQRRSRLL
jgi:hypothetical protein